MPKLIYQNNQLQILDLLSEDEEEIALKEKIEEEKEEKSKMLIHEDSQQISQSECTETDYSPQRSSEFRSAGELVYREPPNL